LEERITESVTLIGDDPPRNNRPATITVTSSIILLDFPPASASRLMFRIAHLTGISCCSQMLQVSFRKGPPLRLQGASLSRLERALRLAVARAHLADGGRTDPPACAMDDSIRIRGDSGILCRELLGKLIESTPSRYHFHPWARAYALVQHGMSLATLYRSASDCRVSLLIAMVGLSARGRLG